MPTILDLDQLHTFVAIAESGSFTNAAENVFKTQSAVSMQMRRLEERLETSLFVKEGRRSILTLDGQKLLEYAQRMLTLNDEAVTAIKQPELRGSVSLGIPDDYSDRLLPELMGAFSKIYPCIEIEVSSRPSPEIAPRVLSGEINLGIVTGGDQHVSGKTFRRENLHWVGSHRHQVHTKRPLPVAIGPSTCCWRAIALKELDRIGIPYRVGYVSGTAAPLISATLAGLAVTILPESGIRPELKVLQPSDGLPVLPPTDIVLMRSKSANQATHDVLANYIETQLGNMRVPVAAE